MNSIPALGFTLLIFYSCWMASADYDYSMSKQGRWAIEQIENVENPNWTNHILLGVGVVISTAVAITVPTAVCLFVSKATNVCFSTSIVSGSAWAAVAALSSIFGGSTAGFKYRNEVIPMKERLRFAKLLRQAYILVNDAEELKREEAAQFIDQYLLAADPNYRITYALVKNPIRELAEKLVLANEAMRFSCWNTLFPQNIDLGLENFRTTKGAPEFSFAKRKGYIDNDINLVARLDIDIFLNPSNDNYLSKESLCQDIESFSRLKEDYEQALAECKQRAREFLKKIDQVQCHSGSPAPSDVIIVINDE